MAKMYTGAVGLKNLSDSKVNPATEDKQDDIISKLSNGFDIPEYDYIALTYVASGNGVGEIETVTYKSGGSGGATVSILTLGYDGSNNLISVTKT